MTIDRNKTKSDHKGMTRAKLKIDLKLKHISSFECFKLLS